MPARGAGRFRVEHSGAGRPAPGAGYVYSGPVAASGYARLGLGRSRIRRAVIMGPSHQVPFAGIAVCSADGFTTPLGNVPVDLEGVEALLSLAAVRRFDPAHRWEHSVEVQLPFCQETLGPFSLVPVVVGDADPADVAEALELVWGGSETAIVISSDLSHYLDHATAGRQDQATAEAIENLQDDAIAPGSACGYRPVRGILRAARRRHMTAEILDIRNSGDTVGDPRRVVGYGAFAFG